MNKNEKRGYIAFIWHGFFLAITMAMLDLNTIFPTLIAILNDSKYVFGALYSVMLSAPLIFNIIFSHYLRRQQLKKKFLLLGMYIRSFSFLGMAIFTYFFSQSYPIITIGSFFLFVFLFSASSGFAGISYGDLMAKTIPSKKRTTLYTIKNFSGSIASLLGGIIVASIFARNIEFPLNYSINLFIGFVGLIVASIGFYFVKESKSEIPEEQSSFTSYIKEVPELVKKERAFKYFVIVENLSSFSIMIMPFYILFAREVLLIEASYIGIFLLIQYVGAIISNIVWGVIGNKFSPKAIVRFCIILGGVNPLIAIITGLYAPFLFGLVFFVMGFTISGRKIGFEPYLLDITPTNKRIEYLGIRGSLNISIIVLPLIGAFFIDTFGYYFAFVLVSIVMFIAAVLIQKVKNKQLEEFC